MKIDIDLSSDNTPISPSVDTVSKKEAEIVDIESIDEPPSKKKKEIASTLPIDESSSVQVKKVIPAPSRTHLLFPEDKEESFKYVGEQAKNLGIQFVQEDIVNKIYYPAAQKVVYRVSIFNFIHLFLYILFLLLGLQKFVRKYNSIVLQRKSDTKSYRRKSYRRNF